MAYVQVPKDLTEIKTKIVFNLTKRQLICFSIAIAVGVPVYFLARQLNDSLAAIIMVIVMLPFFLLAMYRKDGRPLEKILKDIITQKYLRPGIRVYRTANLYRLLEEEEEYDNGNKGSRQKSPKNNKSKR
ncbi:MAG: PrgI family protein [Clostridia bacterium]|nr:PrgI family protein [Clostridia bacterium]